MILTIASGELDVKTVDGVMLLMGRQFIVDKHAGTLIAEFDDAFTDTGCRNFD